MERFIARHQDSIAGVLSGFDRLLFRGSLRSICYVQGLEKFLSSQHVLFKDYAKYVEQLSNQVKQHAEQMAQQQGRPFLYLPSSSTSKEDVAAEIMKRDQVTRGLVCILSCVEPCQTYNLRRDRQTWRLYLVPAVRKCLHLYFYFVDREFGLMHVRLQTWIPLTRIETTINRPGRFKVPRKVTRKGQPCRGWLPVRVGVVDIPQRVAISHAANQRYLEALSVVDLPAPAHEVLDPVSRRITQSHVTAADAGHCF